MSEKIAGNIMLFPNPTTGRFTISAIDGWLAQMDVEVVNMEGKVVSVVNCSGKDSYTFDLSDQPRGSYILRIITSDGAVIRKIVLK